jgi:tight adherence protein C
VIQIVVLLVMLEVFAIGSALRSRRRARRTRRPSRHDDSSPETAELPPATGRLATRCRARFVFGSIVVGAIAAVLVVGPVLTLAAAGCGVAIRRLRSIAVQRRARNEIERSLPDTIELLVLLIHAGLTPVQAVRESAGVAPPSARPGFSAVVHHLDRGQDFSRALAALPEHLGAGAVGLTDLIAGADRNGLPLSPVLESLAYEARAARRRRSEADARRLPVRLSFPLVACTLPSFVLLAIAPAVIAALSSISLSI